ncbi:hypothetical protein [Rhizobium sp. BK008]|uniref:hypothetical protein n=1 Tax=Rhizobium sp. BK008 TaxID=2587094 RepID=UPI001613018E|nr:hypothetical protein [Rhizobium sp. BK008]MBB4252118.1 hypothetical protein [Rhizobium sp. BK008]
MTVARPGAPINGTTQLCMRHVKISSHHAPSATDSGKRINRKSLLKIPALGLQRIDMKIQTDSDLGCAGLRLKALP